MLLEMQAFMTLLPTPSLAHSAAFLMLIIPLLLKEQVGAGEMAQRVKY